MFEHSLIDLAARRSPRRGWLSLPAAIAIHLAAVATLAFGSYWDVGEVPDPPVNLVLVELKPLPPPAPPQARGGGKPETQRVAQKEQVEPQAPRQTVQPPDAPDELPPALPRVAAAAEGVPGLPSGPGRPDGVDGGDENGDPNSGVIGSLTSAPPPVVEARPIADEPIVVGGAVLKPEILVKTQPRYTEPARRANIEGVVVLRAVIDERGYVTDLRVLRSLPMGLDQAAIDAVSAWQFTPATLHGRPVKVYFNLTVNFRIQR